MKILPLKNSAFLFGFTIVVFLALAWFSFQRLNDLIQSTKIVTEINVTRLEIATLTGAITEAESSQRGYLLSSDSLFLGPLKDVIPVINRSFVRLRYSLRNDSLQLRRCKELEEKVQLRLNFLHTNLQRAKGDRIGFEQQMIKGYLFMQDVKNVSRLMLSTENERYVRALELRERYQEVTPVLLLILSIFVFILFTASYYVIRKQLAERIAIQQELEIRIDALNRSNSELEQFAYVASHDLQEPLRKIQAFGDKLVLKKYIVQSEEAEDTVQRMRSAASRMQILINELLAFSRLTRPNVATQYETVSVESAVREVLADLQEHIQEKKALITIEPMPVIEAVPVQMHQLFQNLISNALKFARDNVRPVVRIYADLVSGYMIKGAKPSHALQQFHRITVEDNGIGFDPQYDEKIFVIFQRLHGKMEYSGTGIGLAICRKIVSNHNGYILAEGRPGEGSRFMIFLPVTQSELQGI